MSDSAYSCASESAGAMSVPRSIISIKIADSGNGSNNRTNEIIGAISMMFEIKM